MFTAKSKKIIIAAISFTTLFSLGCKKEKKYSDRHLTDVVSENKPDKIKTLDKAATTNLEGKNIAVVLGYGYNKTEEVEKITETLNKDYGVETAESKGLVSIFVYPDDFLVSGKPRISKLGDLVSEKTLLGMIIIGAPEGTHLALSKIEDATETNSVNYPVISLFPQDDNFLGTESTATFVLDYAHKTATIDSEVTDFIPNFSAELLLSNTIQAIINLKEPLKPESDLLKFVQNLTGKNRIVRHYVDSETNLQSINHFVFE
ncbi:MAG: hypothetical protein II921_07475 [Treponema sp.]|nr:hypothetical protein [Treponema sp.]